MKSNAPAETGAQSFGSDTRILPQTDKPNQFSFDFEYEPRHDIRKADVTVDEIFEKIFGKVEESSDA